MFFFEIQSQMIHFSLKKDQEYIELYKLLKATDLCNSGGEAKIFIADGEVLYNGEVDTRKRLKVRAGDVITFNEQEVTVSAFEE